MQVPTFNNYQTTATALGLAFDDITITAYYISAVGAAIALKSIWATLQSDKQSLNVHPWTYSDLKGQRSFKTLYTPLPESSLTHLLMHTIHDQLVTLVDPRAIAADDETRKTLRQETFLTFTSIFARKLAEISNIPILPEWGKAIYQYCLEQDDVSLTRLNTYGDCLYACLINPDYDWKTVVTHLMQTNKITIPDLANAVTQ